MFRNEAGDAKPAASGTRNQVIVQQSQARKRVATACPSSSGADSTPKRRVPSADDVNVDPTPETTPRELVRECVRQGDQFLSSNLQKSVPPSRTFDVVGYGHIRALVADECGLVGAQLLIPNVQWGIQYAGKSSKCTVVGYVDKHKFLDGAVVPACIVRTTSHGDYAFRCASCACLPRLALSVPTFLSHLPFPRLAACKAYALSFLRTFALCLIKLCRSSSRSATQVLCCCPSPCPCTCSYPALLALAPALLLCSC